MKKGRLKSKVSDDLSFKSIASEKTHIKACLKETTPTRHHSDDPLAGYPIRFTHHIVQATIRTTLSFKMRRPEHCGGQKGKK